MRLKVLNKYMKQTVRRAYLETSKTRPDGTGISTRKEPRESYDMSLGCKSGSWWETILYGFLVFLHTQLSCRKDMLSNDFGRQR